MCQNIDSSLEIEFSRIERFLRTGFELNAVNFDRKSSFNAFLKPFDFRLRKVFKKELKSVRNIWQNVRNKEIRIQSEIAERIERVVRLVGPDSAPFALPRLLCALFRCHSSRESAFRRFSLRFVAESRDVTLVLPFVAFVGRKAFNSRAFRRSLRAFYSRAFCEQEIENLLLFSRFFEWTHRDVIRLAHIPSNETTATLLGENSEENKSKVEKRVEILRNKSSKIREIVRELNETKISSENWYRLLNTGFARFPHIWNRILETLPEDALLRAIPRVVARFPNNSQLKRTLWRRLEAMAELENHFSRDFCLYYCEQNVLKLRFLERISRKLVAMETRDRSERRVLFVLDASLDLEQKFLKNLEKKKRKKSDLLDHVTLGLFAQLFVNAFHCFARVGGDVIPYTSVGSAVDHVIFPFADVTTEWKKCVFFVTQNAPEVNEWPEDEKLVVILVNKVDASFGRFRKNVLVINGFDIRAEKMIWNFISGRN